MVTNREREQFPIFVGPSRRNDEAKQELSGGLLGWLARARVADAVQASRRQQNAAKGGVAKGRGGVPSLKGIKESDGYAGNL